MDEGAGDRDAAALAIAVDDLGAELEAWAMQPLSPDEREKIRVAYREGRIHDPKPLKSFTINYT